MVDRSEWSIMATPRRGETGPRPFDWHVREESEGTTIEGILQRVDRVHGRRLGLFLRFHMDNGQVIYRFLEADGDWQQLPEGAYTQTRQEERDDMRTDRAD